jgi:hypothetical protein
MNSFASRLASFDNRHSRTGKQVRFQCAVPLAVFLIGVLGYESGAAAADEPFKVVIAGGPHAGSYDLPASGMTCVYFHAADPPQFSAMYTDESVKDPKQISGAGINIYDTGGAPGPKGGVVISFGATDQNPPAFRFEVPQGGTGEFSSTAVGSGKRVVFDGKTKDGTVIHMSGLCSIVTAL